MKLPTTALLATTLALLSFADDNAARLREEHASLFTIHGFTLSRPETPVTVEDNAALLRTECQTLRLMLAEAPVAKTSTASTQSTLSTPSTTNLITVTSQEETPETAHLRAECQALRLMLAEPDAIPVPRSLRTNTPPVSVEAQAAAAEGLTHWITSTSGVRHNKKCSNFQKSKGRFCAPDEGRPCRQCGG